MGIGNLGVTEILIVAVIVLLFFGPERIPEISRSIGHALREFRRGVNEIQRELEDVERGVSDAGHAGREERDGPAAGRLEPRRGTGGEGGSSGEAPPGESAREPGAGSASDDTSGDAAGDAAAERQDDDAPAGEDGREG